MEGEAGREGTVVVHPGIYGEWGWNGPTIDQWLGELLASDQGVNKLGKLDRATASERHLVIVLDSFSRAGVGIPLGLTGRHEAGAADYVLPSFTPPAPLTHLWLLPLLETREGLCWRRESGWAALEPWHTRSA